MKQSGWLFAGAICAAFIGLIGLAQPSVALRALLILSVLVAAFALISAIRQLFVRIPPVPDSVVGEQAATTATVGDDDPDLPWHYSGLVPSRTTNPTLAPGARAALRTIATERLWARHHLNVWHPPHEAAIAELLSDRLWALINPNQQTPPPPNVFLHDLLHQHLDELDAL